MRFIPAVFIATLCCCKAAGISSSDQSSLQQIVESELGANAKIEKNNTSNFALAHESKDKTVSFIVVRLTDLKIVVKEKIQGSVTWDKAMSIKVTTIPGIVKANAKPEDNVRIIDLNNFAIQSK
jgi:hypothetical protein